MSVWLAGCATKYEPTSKHAPTLLGVKQQKSKTNTREEFVLCSPEPGPWACANVTQKTRISAVSDNNVATARADLNAAVLNEHPAPLAHSSAPSDRPVAEPKGTSTNSPNTNNAGIVYFDFDKDELRPDAKVVLLDLLPKLRNKKLKLSGFTDSIGAELYNDHLALRRSLNVRSFLITAGFELQRIEASGDGLCCYVATNDSDSERQLNRRVEIQLLD